MIEVSASQSNNEVKIVVVGVGGGGNNAVNRMLEQDVDGVDFVAVNTDVQALANSDAKVKIQIGEKLTGGLGVGAKPDIGRKAAEESENELREMLAGYNMAFITCGMGGGTGTGAAPLISKISKEMGILTVAVVTKPFLFEGTGRMNNAISGISEIEKNVDTLVVIPNEKLFDIMDKKATIRDAYNKADEVLTHSVIGISDIILRPGIINLDFADIMTIMKNKGKAHIGIGVGRGEDKVEEAARMAVESPLLETKIIGADYILLNIRGDQDMGLHDTRYIVDYVQDAAGQATNLIYGHALDEEISDEIIVTVIATDFKEEKQKDFPNYTEDVVSSDENEKEESEEAGGVSIDDRPTKTLNLGEDSESSDFNSVQPKGYETQNQEDEIVIPDFLQKKRR